MKQYEEVFFSVVRAALWKTPVEVPQGFADWNKVLKLAKAQTLTGLVADVLLTNPDIRAQLPEKAVATLQNSVRNNMLMHSLLNNTLILVVSKLRENGVESVLLKGQGIARNYPVPELRQCGDIDLYIGEENYEKAYDILTPIASEIDDKSSLTIGKDFTAKLGRVVLEVHRYADVCVSSKLNRVFRRYASYGLTKDLKTFNCGGVNVHTPANNFNAYYLFGHLFRHYMEGGVGLRQFTDWMMFLHNNHENISKEYLESILTEMNLMEPWKVFGSILVNYLGLPSKEFPLYEENKGAKASKVLTTVLKEGNFGQSSMYGRQRTRPYIIEKLYSLLCHMLRFSSLLFVFPILTIKELYHMLIAGTKAVIHDLKNKSNK